MLDFFADLCENTPPLLSAMCFVFLSRSVTHEIAFIDPFHSITVSRTSNIESCLLCALKSILESVLTVFLIKFRMSESVS